ncbi:UPF0481 protein At3g47200-like [Fagus crenata]
MAANGADSVATNIEGLIEEDMASNDPFMSPNCCIFKTPTILYLHNKKAYVPVAFSIGPFYHGRRNLADTEKIKKKYLDDLISRSPKTKLRDLINSVNEVETEARECYSKPIGYSPVEFVKILVIDGCFIIELFRKKYSVRRREDNDPIFTMSCMVEFLYHDLILLENQVPWMVLDRLYNMTMDSDENESEESEDSKNSEHSEQPETLIKLATNYFNISFSIFTSPPPLPHQTIKDVKHIPDLIIKWMVSSRGEVEQGPNQISCSGEVEQGPNQISSSGEDQISSSGEVEQSPNQISSSGEEGGQHVTVQVAFDLNESSEGEEGCKQMPSATSLVEEGWKHMPSATSLVEAGVKFRRVNSKSILDIRFKDGVLEIPPLKIDELTETYFRNLISFEQCYPNCEGRFTSYAVLIDNLINTTKDVEILCENKIIDNWLNPQDAVPLFNKLYHNTYAKRYYYKTLSRDVNTYCQRRCPRWRAALVRNYFNTPWSVLSTMAAVILLILTFLQTLYTMKQ